MATTLITGANRGIGLALVEAALARGDAVIACCRRPEAATALAELGRSSGGRLTIVAMDVADASSVAAAAQTIAGQPIELLINNAGIIGGEPHGALDADLDDMAHVFAVNVIAPLRVTRAFLANLKAAERARVVAISSQMGSLAGSNIGRVAYRASKAALNKAMRVMAEEMKPAGIAVLLFHPGWVRTDMGGAGADIAADTSATGLLATIARSTFADTGTFRDWRGQTIPF